MRLYGQDECGGYVVSGVPDTQRARPDRRQMVAACLLYTSDAADDS